MTDEFTQRPSTTRAKIFILILIFIIALYMGVVLGIFEEPEEPEGIIVRFILFFKLNTLI